MNKRYKVVEGSNSAHCCFSHSVIDTALGDPRNADAMCECFDEVTARAIAAALNQAEPPQSRESSRE